MTNPVSLHAVQEAVSEELDRRAAADRQSEERTKRSVLILFISIMVLTSLLLVTLDILDRAFALDLFDEFWFVCPVIGSAVCTLVLLNNMVDRLRRTLGTFE